MRSMKTILCCILCLTACKHVGSRSSGKDEISADSLEGILAKNLSSPAPAADTIIQQLRAFAKVGDDRRTAASLRYFYAYPERWNDASKAVCVEIAQNSALPKSAFQCQLMVSGDLFRRDGHGALLIDLSQVLTKAANPSEELAKSLETIDAFIGKSYQDPSATILRMGVAKEVALSSAKDRPHSSYLNDRSWNLLQKSFVDEPIANAPTAIPSEALDLLRRLYPDESALNAENAPYAFLFFVPQINSTVNLKTISFRTNAGFFSPLTSTLRPMLERDVKASAPLMAVYRSRMLGPLHSPAAVFSGYDFQNQDASSLGSVGSDFQKMSETFASSLESLGCAKDKMLRCGPSQSFYHSLLKPMMQALNADTSASARTLSCDNVPGILENRADPCVGIRLMRLAPDASSAASFLQLAKADSNALNGYAARITLGRASNAEETAQQFFLATKGSTRRNSALLFLCLSYYERPESSPFDEGQTPREVTDVIYWNSRVFYELAGHEPGRSTQMDFGERHAAVVKTSQYCDDEMGSLAPARSAQETLKEYIFDKNY